MHIIHHRGTKLYMDHQERLIYDLPNNSHLISDLHTGFTSKKLANLFLSCSLFMQNRSARRILQRALLLKLEASFSSYSLTALKMLDPSLQCPNYCLGALNTFQPPFLLLLSPPLWSTYPKRNTFAIYVTGVWQCPHCSCSDPFLSSVSFIHEVLKKEIQSLIIIVLSSRLHFKQHL